MHQSIRDQDDATLGQKGRNPDRAIFGGRIKNVVEQTKHMCGFSSRTGHQSIAMAMRQHQSRKHVPVTRRKTVNILRVMTTALQSAVEIGFVLVEMRSIASIDDFQLTNSIPKTCRCQFLPDIIIPSNNKRAAKT